MALRSSSSSSSSNCSRRFVAVTRTFLLAGLSADRVRMEVFGMTFQRQITRSGTHPRPHLHSVHLHAGWHCIFGEMETASSPPTGTGRRIPPQGTTILCSPQAIQSGTTLARFGTRTCKSLLPQSTEERTSDSTLTSLKTSDQPSGVWGGAKPYFFFRHLHFFSSTTVWKKKLKCAGPFLCLCGITFNFAQSLCFAPPTPPHRPLLLPPPLPRRRQPLHLQQPLPPPPPFPLPA
jgi:hypothetical protein